MKGKIMRYVANDIQKTMKRLGVWAEFTPIEIDGRINISSADFDLHPMIFKSIHVNGAVYVVKSDNDIIIRVRLGYDYVDWNDSINGTYIGMMEYIINANNYDNDTVYENGSITTIKKIKSVTV